MAFLLCPVQLMAQYNGYKDWPRDERQLTGKYLLTDEATLLADKILEFQLPSGGWPMNIYYPQVASTDVQTLRKKYQEENRGTIENSATLSEIHFLSNMFQATALRRYRKAAEQGIQFLLDTQYPNGGWPICFPSKTDRDGQISFAGENMVNVLALLHDISQKKEPYSYLSDDLRTRVEEAFQKGLACILNAQCRQQGKPTVWCAQHDAQTLAPVAASPLEPAALSGNESAPIVLLLMGITNPDAFVREAIEGAVTWFQTVAIKGMKRENYINKEGKRDYRLIPDVHAADMWARFYSLEDNQPFFTSENGEKVQGYEDLSRNRRTSISWYSNEPQRVLRRYERWKQKLQN